MTTYEKELEKLFAGARQVEEDGAGHDLEFFVATMAAAALISIAKNLAELAGDD